MFIFTIQSQNKPLKQTIMAKTVEEAQDNVLNGFDKEVRNAGRRTYLNAMEEAIIAGEKNKEYIERKKKEAESRGTFVAGSPGYHGISEDIAAKQKADFEAHLANRDQDKKERAKAEKERNKAKKEAQKVKEQEAKDAAFKAYIAKKAQEQIALRNA